MLRTETFTGPAWQWEGLAPVNVSPVPMASTPPARLKRDAPSGAEGRHPPLHILFVHSHLAEVERCLKVLDKLHFTVNAEVVVTPEEFTERLGRGACDLVVAEHPSPNWRETQALELLHLSNRQIPLIFVSSSLQRETVADFITKGAYDCIEMDHIGHLPVAVHRALDEKALRDERDRAQIGLRHSEARYRALAGNLSYGICRCGRDGKFLEVNEAMVKMLGYASKEELLAVNLASGLIQDADKRAQLLGQPDQQGSFDPLEIEWKRKDHTTLKVRLTGQEILGEQGQLDAYEVITEDVTKQRQLEDHLRQQAARDPLTGLANYRHLAEVLDMEIKHFRKMAVVGQSCQWVASCLLTQMILQLALFGDILSDDLIGVQPALFTQDFLSGESDFHRCVILPLPFYFDGVDCSLQVWL